MTGAALPMGEQQHRRRRAAGRLGAFADEVALRAMEHLRHPEQRLETMHE